MNYIVNPGTRFNDVDGRPLTLGTVDTYIAGTSEPVITYKDFNGTANPSHITLDDYGGCVIIVPEGQLIKLVIRDRHGLLVRTFDNVRGGEEGISGLLAGDYISIVDNKVSVDPTEDLLVDESTMKLEHTEEGLVLSVSDALKQTAYNALRKAEDAFDLASEKVGRDEIQAIDATNMCVMGESITIGSQRTALINVSFTYTPQTVQNLIVSAEWVSGNDVIAKVEFNDGIVIGGRYGFTMPIMFKNATAGARQISLRLTYIDTSEITNHAVGVII